MTPTTLDTFAKLMRDMEPEHRPLLKKIAFSPIHGNPKFGEAIVAGKQSTELIDWYNKLFPQFEAYRRMIKQKSATVDDA